VGRAQTVVEQMEARSRAAADMLHARYEEISESIKTNSGTAERNLVQLVASTTEAIGKTTAASSAATDALNRSAAEATVSLNRSAGVLSNSITSSATAASDAIGRTAAAANDTISKSAAAATDSIEKTAAGATDLLGRTALATGESVERSANEAERKLLGMSAEVARNIVGKTNELSAVLTQRLEGLTDALDEKSINLVTTLTSKGSDYADQVQRITDETVRAIESRGFVFAQKMMDNSQEIARLINDSSQNAAASLTRTLGQMQEGTHSATEAAKLTIARSIEDLRSATRAAVEETKQSAAATVADMVETHNMLRSDSTALFERLREANILLQEVLSGAHENMSSIEHTMATRISEFVTAMNSLSDKSGIATSKVEQHLGAFNTVTATVLQDLGGLAEQFTVHGRSVAEAVELLDASNRRTEQSVATRQASIEAMVSTLDTRTEDFGQRLQRFSGLLDESLDTATTRAREIASLVAETSNDSVQTIERQFDLIRTAAELERVRTSEALSNLYTEATAESQTILSRTAAESQAIFNQTAAESQAVVSQTAAETQSMLEQSAARFTEVVRDMKQMAAEMQQELESTRAELRRGIFELPQETAESAAQMRRVIVDQIEALAELNRIVARHGRSIDAAEPARREAEPAYATGGTRAAVRPGRQEPPSPAMRDVPRDIPRDVSRDVPRDITGAPTRRGPPPLSPVPGGRDSNRDGNRDSTRDTNRDNANGNGRNGGWLSDLLSRASREESPPIVPPGPREVPRSDEPFDRDNADPLDSLSVDIARMIDHDVAADVWERYKRGERGVFSRRLYTTQGQRAFDEIRAKYRGDPDFRQTVEHYIHEFERLLDDVSRGDRGPAVARNYLISDTGKVYTMLAHAAGRFDQ